MFVYRLCRAAFASLDGEGARLYRGRWNSPGQRVVYTSGSLALASLEYMVHVPAELVPVDLVALTIQIPDDISPAPLDVDALPSDWHEFADHPACRDAGDAWLRRGEMLLRVPAAPIPTELNVLINADHSEAHRVTVVARRPFRFDPRFIR